MQIHRFRRLVVDRAKSSYLYNDNTVKVFFFALIVAQVLHAVECTYYACKGKAKGLFSERIIIISFLGLQTRKPRYKDILYKYVKRHL